jgi:hypothetical protein
MLLKNNKNKIIYSASGGHPCPPHPPPASDLPALLLNVLYLASLNILLASLDLPALTYIENF